MEMEKGSGNSAEAKHRWRFFRSGGFDQVRLETGADLMALDQLDQKLWMALSCPTRGLEFDERTLALLDDEGDGRIRVPDIIRAVKWAGSLFKNPDDLTRGAAELPLAAIDDASEEGRRLLLSAREILANLGKPDAAVITVDDTADTSRILAQTRFNGDGIVPADVAEDPGVRQTIEDIMDCLGPETDRSGKPGVSQEKVDGFFTEAQAYSDWWREASTDATILPLGEATAAAAAAFQAVRAKVEDYFIRCRLAKYDVRALGALNRQETEYIAIADKSLAAPLEELAGFPVAQVGLDKPLPLKEGINPAWVAAVAAFDAGTVRPLLGEKIALTELEWGKLYAAFAPYEAWLARKAGTAVEKLGPARVCEILEGPGREAIEALIAKDRALEAEFDHIASVDRLLRYHRDLFGLLNNFVSFSEFYARRNRAIFQAGTLYLDGRSCDLCVRVEDAARHASLAALSQAFLAYCDCTRKVGAEKMTIAAAFTDGDSDYLVVGRNGVFYDRKGQIWDATISRVVDHPISIRQAFWSPYKRIGRMINDQITKMASARDRVVTDRASVGIARTSQKAETARPTPAAAPPPAPFDVGKFAGIFAAIGLALGAIGTAIAAVVTGFMSLHWWQMPLAITGLVLVISGPSMIMAWLKLRQRTIGPILDANGWAINGRVRINAAFGGSLTKVAALPEGASRSLEDPFADKKSPWPKILVLIAILLALLYIVNQTGLLHDWTRGIIGKKPAATGTVQGGSEGAPKAAAP